jgi:hypothetical protein
VTPRSGGHNLAQQGAEGGMLGTELRRGAECRGHDTNRRAPHHGFAGPNNYPAAMCHTYAHNLMHCVFSTTERLHLIRDPESLWRYTVGLAYEKKVHVISAGGTTNHAHLLILVPQTLPLAKVMQEMKPTPRWPPLRGVSALADRRPVHGGSGRSESAAAPNDQRAGRDVVKYRAIPAT